MVNIIKNIFTRNKEKYATLRDLDFKDIAERVDRYNVIVTLTLKDGTTVKVERENIGENKQNKTQRFW